jgi:hypothetical protein
MRTGNTNEMNYSKIMNLQTIFGSIYSCETTYTDATEKSNNNTAGYNLQALDITHARNSDKPRNRGRRR